MGMTNVFQDSSRYYGSPQHKEMFMGGWMDGWIWNAFWTALNCLYLTQFLTDFGQILDSKSYDQA